MTKNKQFINKLDRQTDNQAHLYTYSEAKHVLLSDLISHIRWDGNSGNDLKDCLIDYIRNLDWIFSSFEGWFRYKELHLEGGGLEIFFSQYHRENLTELNWVRNKSETSLKRNDLLRGKEPKLDFLKLISTSFQRK